MKQKILFIATIVIMLGGALLLATWLMQPKETAETNAINAANQLYQVGNYDDAIHIYQQIVDQDVEDSTIYFNLGNSYFSKGDLGRAILNYQRAAMLAPRDRDIAANLELARTKANAVIDQSAPGPLSLMNDLTGKWLTLNEAALLTMGLWFLVSLMFIVWRLQEYGSRRQITKNLMIIVFLVLAIAGLSLGSRLVSERYIPEGVVVAPVVAVNAEPGQQSELIYNLQNGAEISLMETQGNWAHLAIPGSQIEGWVPLDTVEMVANGSHAQDFLLY